MIDFIVKMSVQCRPLLNKKKIEDIDLIVIGTEMEVKYFG